LNQASANRRHATATVGSLPVRDDKGKTIADVVFTAVGWTLFVFTYFYLLMDGFLLRSWAVPLAIILMIIVSKLTAREIPSDVRLKMLVLHAPEELGLKQEYIQEHPLPPVPVPAEP
jgi:hypothetical protein